MKDVRKYTGTELAKALTASYGERNGYDYTFSYDDIMTLALAWAAHPEFYSPKEATIYSRERLHGELWLEITEIPSFANYIGYKLLAYLK